MVIGVCVGIACTRVQIIYLFHCSKELVSLLFSAKKRGDGWKWLEKIVASIRSSLFRSVPTFKEAIKISPRRRRVKRVTVRRKEKKKKLTRVGGEAYDLTRQDKWFMYETVECQDGITFCCFDGDEFYRLDVIEQADHYIVPPPEEKVTWALPKLIEGKGNPPDAHPLFTTRIWERVRQFIYDYLELPDDPYYNFLTAFVFATYFADIPLSTSPYPFFMGLKRTGKTRALEVLSQLCFRAKMAISISGAAIPTNVKLIHPTLLVDEASLMDEEKKPLILKMFLAYRPDMYYERKNPKGKSFEQLDVSECYCYKAIASRKDLTVNLADRCVYINMKKRSRKLKRWRRSLYENEGEKIRTQLLELRMRYWNTLEEDEDFRVRDDRVEELFIPIATMAKVFGPKDAYDDVYAVAEKVMSSFEREKAMSFEHDVVEAIYNNRVSISDEGLLPTSTIADDLFKDGPSPADFRKLSNTLKSLGFEKVNAKYGDKKKRCVVVDDALLEHYVAEYNIEEAEVSSDELERNMCEECGRELGKLRLIPGKGEKWLCDGCAEKEMGVGNSGR